MEWAEASLKLRVDVDVDVESSDPDAGVLNSLAWLIEEGKLLLGSGASVSIKLERASDDTVIEVWNLLAAISQPRKVDIEVLSGSFDVDDEIDKNFLRDLVLGVLRELQPEEGAASLLESLSICLDAFSDADEWRDWPSASADELREALAPFGALRSLGIFFEQVGAAAVIVAACPNLRSIRLQAKSSDGPDDTGDDWDELLRGVSDILAALAPLACLEHVTLEYPDHDTDEDDLDDRVCVSGGLWKLAKGAAGKAIRDIRFDFDTWLFRCVSDSDII
eukprot:tig00000514_g1793.t1